MIFFLAKRILKLLSKISAKKGYEFLSDMSDEDVVRNVDYLSHALRSVRKRGAGVALAPIRLALRECAVVFRRKEKGGLPLFGFEKWLSDNQRVISSALSSIRDLSDLPHVNGVPRIVILADFIVRYSGGKVTVDRVRKVLAAFRSVTPLTYGEISALSSALRYRLLFEISLLAERSIHYYTSSVRAEKARFREKYALSDAYCYAFIRSHGEGAFRAARSECDPASVLLGFENVLADDEVLAAAYVGSLREIFRFDDKAETVSLSSVNEIFRACADYLDMSAEAKASYLERCGTLAEKLNLSETAVAHGVMALADSLGVHFGEILFYYPKALARYLKTGEPSPLGDEKRRVQGGYATAVLGVSLLIAAFPAYFLRDVWAYLSVLPLFIAVLHPVEYLLKRFLSLRIKGRPVPQMDYDVLPERLRTVVVVSRFVAGKEDARAAIRQAETLAAGELDPNVGVVVLVDFPSAEEAWRAEDEQLASYLGSLPRSPRISILIRKRRKKGDRYVAWERKRGAILDLFSAMESRDFSGFLLYGEEPRATYAILFDDDSELLPGTIRAAILSMAHPLNAEYDLMSFGGKVNRYSLETHYSERYLRCCSVDAYPFYSDFYSDAFDAALYCGKAIVRIPSYLEKLRDFFPNGRVLSHDVIEGAVLRSASLRRCVFEDAPDTFVSDAVRTVRWQRGDVQLLPYAFCSRVKDREGRRIPNPIAPIYRLILFINGFGVLRDAMLWFVVLLSFFAGEPFLIGYAISCLLVAKAYALIDSLRAFFTNVRFSHAARGFIRSLGSVAEELFLSPYRAVVGLYVFVVTCFKMAIRSPSLLEWRPFRTTQGAGGVGTGAELLLPSVILLSAFVLFAGDLRVSLYALFVCLYALALLFEGRKISVKAPSQSLRLEWKRDAENIYAYFDAVRGEGLPTDNLQLFPYEMRSRMTSPTNLGFALLAEVSAAILGLVSADLARERFLSLLSKVEGLERWKGHLYNWYDVKTFRVMPPRVVSTVDSANFVACLYVAAAYWREQGESSLAERVERMADQADFTALYRPEEKALAIVRYPDEERMEGRYDLLASESRLAYCFAIAQGVDPACYFSLGRECDGAYGNTLLSWSGTAFEYMLPRLFLRAPKGSLLAEQERRSGRMQMRDRSEGVFGRSECGYAEFDDSGAYRYKAIGCACLALSSERADVIAPYASYLYMSCFPLQTTENLCRLREMGLEGRYGFYEAMDLEAGRPVMSYMTHHQGMSLAALTNALTGDELVRLFSESGRVRAIRLLLAEENIYERLPKRSCSHIERPKPVADTLRTEGDASATLAIRNGEFTAVYDASGRGRTVFRDYLIGKYRPYLPEIGGLFVQIKEKGEVYSPTAYPCGDADCVVEFSQDCVCYDAPSRGVSMSVTLLDGYDGELRKVTVHNDGDAHRELTLSAFCDVALNTADAYDSHPAYSDMFVAAEYDEETHVEYLYRKGSDCRVSLAASLSVKGLEDVRANCNAYNAIGRGGDARSDLASGIEKGRMPPFGDVLYPCFSFSGSLSVPPYSEASFYLVLLATDSIESLKVRNQKVDLAYRSGAIELIGRSGEEHHGDLSLSLSVCSRLLFRHPAPSVLAARYTHREEFIAKGVPLDSPLLFLDLTESYGRELFERVARLSERLRRSGVPHTLSLAVGDTEGAGMNGADLVRKKLREIGAEAVLVGAEEKELFRSASEIVFPLLAEDRVKSSPVRPLLTPDDGRGGGIVFRTGEGGFTEAGYRVIPFEKATLLPYANVVGGEEGGFVVTERGGGYTFGANSRENKITVWSGDALRDPRSEEVTLDLPEGRYLLNGDHAEHRIGSTDFIHLIHGEAVRLSLSLAEKGACKVFEVLFGSEPPEGALLGLSLYFALGWRFDDGIFAERVEKGFKLISTNGATAYAYCDVECEIDLPRGKSDPFRIHTVERLARGACRFYLSSKPIDFGSFDLVRSRAEAMRGLFRSAINARSGRFALDELYDRVLPYQTLSARINAKTGFYQCGGAVGFRDQLQDCLAFLLTDPDLAKRHILDAAAHQYAEGDVQHWWHPPRIGVRTRISDDRLWLVYLTARYVETSGVDLILDEQIPFLTSPTLAEGEISRYEIPKTGEVATLREHLRRAILRTLDFGEHDLLKIGSGDWNDGLDRVGVRGRGESVWLSMFACRVIEDSLRFFGAEDRRIFASARDRLVSALKPLFRGGRYPLAFADDGTWLGYSDSSACTHSLNPQTWAVLCGALPTADAKRALLGASDLVDEQAEIVRISVPPFDKNSNYGYIAAYPKGVRENGGQYTHAAVWYLKALLAVGERDKAYRVLTMLNPISRSTDESRAKTYMGEPYVLAGDVYGFEPYRGRAGWSWYTGSAGWLHYVLTEDFYGIKKRGDRLYLEPNLPTCMNEAEVTLRFAGKTVSIRFLRARENALFVNDVRAEYVDLSSEGREISVIRHFC
ncbi:MAG: hypothetical protein IJT69_00335 [Clostridia bacterium]|nr:hypothetical protein [Clostridia bacterium]